MNKMENKVEEILKQLTLEEKIGMIHGAGLFRTEGVERLAIPPLKSSDGPMGVRQEYENDNWKTIGTSDDYVTYLPSNSAVAAAWNKELAYETGKVLGEEARGRGKDVILAPGINIKRDPLCGRNFEYMSEDPCLIKELAVPLIQGIQENDVAACVKHFALNNQETDRLAVDTIVDERALREIYLPGFKAAVQKGESYSIMGAYNKVDGVFCCESKRLLKEILKEEWGYDGTVISDWGAVHTTKETAEVPMDIEMSVYGDFENYYFADALLEAVKKGEVKESCIDEKIRNVLRMMLRLKMIGEESGMRRSGTYNTPEHRAAALQVAREAVVLLKNEDKRLPLDKKNLKKIAVIGQNASVIHSNGGGSAEIKALYEISPLMGLKTHLGGNAEITYAPGYYIPEKTEEPDTSWQERSLETEAEKDVAANQESENQSKESQDMIEAALALAARSDEVIFVGGLNHDYDVEGQDRKNMKLPYGQDELIQKLLQIKPDMVIVLIAGSPVEMPWKDSAKAIVWSYYAGMETGNVVAEVLLGEQNPCGKLPETFPVVYEDTVTFENGEFGKEGKVEYKEGIYVGYRYYDLKKKKTAFCFGHGLSYTEYQYEDMEISLEEKKEDIEAVIKVAVKNTGSVKGMETVQLYVGAKNSSVNRPVKELRAFAKQELNPQEKKVVTLSLNKEAFGYYDMEKKAFVILPGEYEIMAGASAEDLRLFKTIKISKEYIFQ